MRIERLGHRLPRVADIDATVTLQTRVRGLRPAGPGDRVLEPKARRPTPRADDERTANA